MARSTLAELTQILRSMTDTGTADWTSGTASMFDADQMQLILDRYRRDVYRALMTPVETYNGGTVIYKDYYTDTEHIETTSGGTAVFYLEDAAGTAVGTALYTMDYIRGQAVFASDTGGSSYYWYGRSFDMNRAAADIWRTKASHYATQFDFSTDNHSLKKGAVYEHCLKMADYYERKASTSMVTTVYRSDLC